MRLERDMVGRMRGKMVRVRRRAIAAAPGVGLLLTAGGCPKQGGGARAAVTECNWTPNSPGEAGNVSGISTLYLAGTYSVRGEIWVQCTTPPEQHDVTLQLQRWVDGWLTVDYEVIKTIPTIYWAPRQVTLTPCVPGNYRLVVDLIGMSSTGVPFTSFQVLATTTIHDVMCKDNK